MNVSKLKYGLTYLIIACIVMHSSAQDFFQISDDFFKKYTQNGLVNYQAIEKNPQEIQKLKKAIAAFNPNNIEKKTAKAFYINAYNLLVIYSIMADYPVKSPQNIPNFFTGKIHLINQKKVSLNEIEKDILKNTYHDERLHFVLVCAAKGCPQIMSAAYLPEQLEKQIAAQTTQAINNDNFVRISSKENKVSLAKIFSWYKDEFTKGNTTLINYINRYRTKKIPPNYKVNFYDYDWQLNSLQTQNDEDKNANSLFYLQSYTPSVLFSKGQWELKIFHNMYTQTARFGDGNSRVENGRRETFYTIINQFLYGISKNLNAGFDFWAKSTLVSQNPSSSPFNIFSPGNSANHRFAPIYFGPKIKIAPIPVKGLSFESIFLLPLAKDLESRSPESDTHSLFLEFDRFLWINQVYFDKKLAAEWQLFIRLSFWYSFVRNSFRENNFLETPLSGFISYFPSNRVTLYFQTETWFKHWSGAADFRAFNSMFLQSGMGIKYQLIPNLIEIEGLYTKFLLGSAQEGAGETYNIGVRLIH